MAYESFYGGRQGASFVIVKQYASIAEMLTEFAGGGSTTKEVNYGEYVIIDTPDKNNSENGCVYRRGMNYDAQGTDPIKDPGKGAEYIGQIVGPEGSIKNIEVDKYDPTAGTDPLKPGDHKEQAPADGGIVPGKGQDIEGTQVQNNSIKYSYANVLDAQTGHIEKYLIGFQFPYFQQEQEIELTDPYNIPEELIEDVTPKDDDLPEGEHATQTDRPFYRKYKLKVPKGVKGDSVKQICSVPTIVTGGSTVYLQVSEDGTLSEPDRVLTNDLTLNVGRLINYESTRDKGYINQKENNIDKYARLLDIDINSQHEGFLIYDYAASQEGQGSQYDGGINSYISEMVISNGSDVDYNKPNHLLVYYTDPGLRNAIPPIQRVTYEGKSNQCDLGYVKGEPGTSPIMGRINSLDELYFDQDPSRPKKPEDVGDNDSYRGQVVTLDVGGESDQIWAYDYLYTNDQYKVGTFGGGGGGNGFIISATEPADLGEGGIQGKTEVITYH